MTRLLLFYSIAVAVIISPVCSGESQWSQSNAVEHEERTKIVYSSRVAWNPFNSHFRVQYKVFTASSSLRISYALQCARLKEYFWGAWSKWVYKSAKYIDMNLDLNPSQDTKTACIQLYGIDEEPKCNKFRLKIKIEYTSEKVDHLTLTDTCSTNSSETRYKANCDFNEKDSCGYRNDLCSLVPWKFNEYAHIEDTDSIKPLQDLDTPISCELLSKLDLTVLQPPEFLSEEKKKRSVETPETRIAKSVSNGYYLCIDGRDAGEIVATGIINSPILTKHAQYNKALQFGYTFERSGVHSLVVALICVSNGDRIMHLKDDFTHFRMNNEVEQPTDRSDVICLDIHTFLNGCEKFQVQFAGGARSSRLIIDDIYYRSNCPSGYDNR